MKINKAIATATILSTLLSQNICFADKSNIKLEYEKFETYGNTVSAPWRAQGLHSSINLCDTANGKSAKIVTDTSGMEELICDYSPISESSGTLIMGMSLYFEDFKSQRMIYTRSSAQELQLISIEKDGTVRIGTVLPSSVITLSAQTWYDFVVEYNVKTGYIRVTVTDGENDFKAERTIYEKNIMGVYRLDIAQSASSEGESITYADNCYVYEQSLGAKEYPEQGKTYDFEDYEFNVNGLTPPSGWRIQNASEGLTGIYADEVKLDGKSMKLTSNGTRDFEIITEFSPISGNGTMTFDFVWLGGTVQMGFRCKRQDGGYLSEQFLITIINNGHLRIGNNVVGTLTAGKRYKLTANVDMTSKILNVSATGDNETLNGNVSFSPASTSIWAFEFYTYPDNSITEYYVDNFSLISDDDKLDVFNITPKIGYFNEINKTVTFEFTKPLKESDFKNLKLTVNGDENAADFSYEGNKAYATLNEDLISGKKYMFELCGDEIYAFSVNFCEDEIRIFNSKSDIGQSNIGYITSSSTIKSATDKFKNASMIVAVRDRLTNRIVSAKMKSVELEKAKKINIEVMLEIPSEYNQNPQNFEINTYLWDSIYGMISIAPSKTVGN